MSNAFNLSLLANFVDSSGKVNISTGSTGTLPTTQGGTGLTTVGTAGQVLQSNGTTLSYVTPSSGGVTSLNGQTGAIDDTTQFAIGSYVIGRPQNTTNYNNSTLAGSSLYMTIPANYYVNTGENAGWNQPSNNVFTGGTSPNTLVNTGSWRCVSGAWAKQTSFGAEIWAFPGLWVRYA